MSFETVHATRPAAARRGWWARLRARVTGWELDRRLLRGESPGTHPELAERISLLTGPRHRHLLARSLDSLLEVAATGRQARNEVPVRREQVLDGTEELHALARDLADAESVEPRGVILTERLLRDGCGPVFNPRCPETVENAAKHARTALHLR
jgi:hypothetical protein